MRKARHLKTFILSLGATLAITSVGFSAFLEVDGTASQGGLVNMDSNSKAVCYNETTSTYYTSIEKALQVGNGNQTADVIYVIPGINPTISKSCTISKEDTLVLPYEAAEYSGSSNQYFYRAVTSDDMPTTEDYDSVQTTTKIANVYSNSANVTSTITVTNGATITINGALFIGGVQSGSNGGNIAGFVTKCAKMVLSNGASIQNNGTFVNFGYVVGEDTKDSTEPHVINAAGSMSYGPFVVVEHRGGTVFSNLASCEGSPFNRFYFPSFVNVVVKYGGSASFTAIPDLYADSHHNRCKVSIVGSDGLIAPKDDFSLISLFTFEDSDGNTDLNGGVIPKNYLNFYGPFDVNSLSLTVTIKRTVIGEEITIKVPLSTKKCYFPLSCYYDIKLNKANNGNESVITSSEQKIKVLPGSRLVIGESVSFSCPGLAIYAKYDSNKYASQIGEDSDINGIAGAVAYEKMNEDGILIVNGTLQATEFGGFVQTNTTGAIISFEANSAEVYEVEQTNSAYYGFTLSASGNIGSDSTEYFMRSGSYTSEDKHWCTYDIYGVSLSVTDGTSESGKAAEYSIKASYYPYPSLSSNVAYSWTCTKDGESIESTDGVPLSSNEGDTITLTTPANSTFVDVKYVVTCVVTYVKEDGTTETLSVTSGDFIATAIVETEDTLDISVDRDVIAYASTGDVSEATITPSVNGETPGEEYSVTYQSGDENIATVDANSGVVTPVGNAAGMVTITATFAKNGKDVGSKTVDITVHTIGVYYGTGSTNPANSYQASTPINFNKSSSASVSKFIYLAYDENVKTAPAETLSQNLTVNNAEVTCARQKITQNKQSTEYPVYSINNKDTHCTVTKILVKRTAKPISVTGNIIFSVFDCNIEVKIERTE